MLGLFKPKDPVEVAKKAEAKKRVTLIAENPVKAAVMYFVDLPVSPDLRISVITGEIEKLEDMRPHFFGVEQESIKECDKRIDSLKAELFTVNKIKEFAGIYPRFHYKEALSWRTKEGWPRLAVFGLDSSVCKLRVENTGTKEQWFIEPKSLPWEIGHCFDDVFGKLETIEAVEYDFGRPKKRLAKVNQCIRGTFQEISAHFTGAIPNDVREKIFEAQRVFGNHIYIFAEAPQWQIGKMIAVVKPDPLVVGWDGANCWLIATFDVTPFEELIKREYTTT